ncbi:phage tail tape measure protein [Breoghania sp. JC706]|uniref:phage tail tape measure protein n=1 Tax=Breoghania sp. JC706 TaxID=3117732 RepID=UPI0030080DDA
MSDLTMTVTIQFLSKGLDIIRQDLEDIRDLAATVGAEFSKGIRENLKTDEIKTALKANEARLKQAREKLMDAFAVFAPLRAAAAFDDAFSGIEKVLDVSAERLKVLRRSVLDMSREIAVSATGLMSIMATAARAGIPTDQLERFTAFAAKASVAFDMAGDQIAERFARLRDVYRLDQEGLEDLADAASQLSINMDARAGDILNFADRAAAAQSVLKLNVAQMEALGAAMIAAGASPEEAARGVKAFASHLAEGTSDVRAALRTAGVDYDQFMASLDRDAPVALTDLFARLSHAPGGMQALNGLGGQDLSKLAGNQDLLARSFKTVGNVSGYAGSATDKYDKRAQSAGGHWQLLKNRMDAIAITAGNTFLPALTDIMGGLGSIVSIAGQFSEDHPTLTSWLIKIGLGLLAIVVPAIRLYSVLSKAWKIGSKIFSWFWLYDKTGKNVSVAARGVRLLRRGLRAIYEKGAKAGGFLAKKASGAARWIGERAVGAIKRGGSSLGGAFRWLSSARSKLVKSVSQAAPGLGRKVRSGAAGAWGAVRAWVSGGGILKLGKFALRRVPPILIAEEAIRELQRTPEERMRLANERAEQVDRFREWADNTAPAQFYYKTRQEIKSLLGLEKDEVPAEVFGRWVKRKLGIGEGTEDGPRPLPIVPPPNAPSRFPDDDNGMPTLWDYLRGRLPGQTSGSPASGSLGWQPSQITMTNHFTINGVSDPEAAANATVNKIQQSLVRTKTGALHDGE